MTVVTVMSVASVVTVGPWNDCVKHLLFGLLLARGFSDLQQDNHDTLNMQPYSVHTVTLFVTIFCPLVQSINVNMNLKRHI